MAVTTRSGWRRVFPRFGLRAQVVLAFSVGALLLSLLLSGLVLAVTRGNLVNQRESSATRQTYFNARNVRSQISTAADTLTLLSSLQTPEGARPILFAGDQWTALDPEFGRDALPQSLRRAVLRGSPSRMRFETGGVPQLAIGIPMPAIDGAYFEIVSLTALDDTLSSIGFTLFGASIATTLGGAAFGWYASRRILRPLAEVGEAATAITGGRLDARISALVDPDLEAIVTSFNGMVDALSERIQRDARFASDVSHELRSPLMTLQASVEVLQNARDEIPERSKAALDLLAADVDRFRQLVEDLLEISRFDAGVMRLELQEVLLSDYVRHLVRGSGHEVPVEMAPELEDVIVALDPRRIARVLANLLENAAKYGDGASLVTVWSAEDRVRIAVDDRGEGVAEEDRTTIFERFNRAGAANRRGTGSGVGLGLALVAEHVRLHDGSVWVEDAPGGGARFVVDLPRIELEDDELQDEVTVP